MKKKVKISMFQLYFLKIVLIKDHVKLKAINKSRKCLKSILFCIGVVNLVRFKCKKDVTFLFNLTGCSHYQKILSVRIIGQKRSLFERLVCQLICHPLNL